MAFTPLGIIVALTFIGLPFVVRTLQPAIEEIDRDTEEAAASLGASRWQTFRRVILPALLPALLTGFALSFARALGEYGSVVFISGNMPMRTEIASLLIISKLEQYDVPGAAAIATVMLLASFLLLLVINALQWWAGRKLRGARYDPALQPSARRPRAEVVHHHNRSGQPLATCDRGIELGPVFADRHFARVSAW